MRSYSSIIIILLITLFRCSLSRAETDDDDPFQNVKKCPGGYCVKTFECQDGKINVDGEGIVGLRFNDLIDVDSTDDDPCEEFLLRCCSYSSDEESSEQKPPKPPVRPNQQAPLVCGMNRPDGYLVTVQNKSLAQFAEFPWMVALVTPTMMFDQSLDVYFCGGSLIHPQVVLTAAHCLDEYSQPEQIIARLGEWDTITKNEPLAHQQIGVQKIIIHEQANTRVAHNNVALLILNKPAKLDVHINPICLPSATDNFDGNRCLVSGWGKEDFSRKGQYSQVLKKLELPVVARSTCQRNLRKTRLGPFFRLHESFTCAGGEEGVDACTGDGGAPLACAQEEGRYVQAGIVSWGMGCGVKDLPGVYVDVRKFVDWIEIALENEGLSLS